MRIALLSTLDTTTESAPGQIRPPFAQFAGASVVERQLDLALAMDCRAVACLSDSVGREVIALQHRAERAGIKFVTLRDSRLLSGLVTAGDEIVLFANAVLPDNAAVIRQGVKPAVMVFPADVAVPLGYERISAEFAWSGVLIAPGGIVERLSDLPPDADVPSSLLRIALQSGVRPVSLERRLLDEGEWHLSANAEALADREARFIRMHAAPAPFSAPGIAVAERMGIRVAQDILDRNGTPLPWIAAAVAAIGALGLALFGMPEIGIALAMLMATAVVMGQVIERIGQAGEVQPKRSLLARVTEALVDPVLIVLITLASPPETGWLRVFVPLILFGLLRLAARIAPSRWRVSFQDRIILSLALIPLSYFGLAQEFSGAIATLVLVSLLRDENADE